MRLRVSCLTLTCAAALVLQPLALERLTGSPAAVLQPVVGGALAAAPDQHLTAGDVTLRYRQAGSGDPVVLLHGYTASLESQIPLANALPGDHRVVALDVRGFGQSSKFADPARFGHLMVDDVVRLMDHLEIPRAHLIGHSMGALIAANVASRYPNRVRSATLIAGPFYPDKPSFARESARWAADLEAGRGLANFAQWLFPKMDPKVVAATNAMIMKGNDLPSLIAVMRSLPDLAIAGLRTTAVPSLVTVGTGDPLHPLSKEFAKSSPGARLLEIAGADHVSVAAHADVTRAVRELMQRVGSRE